MRMSVKPKVRTSLVAAAVCGLVSALAGCSEAVINQYTRLGKWIKPADAPQVISASPATDQAAFDASEEALSEADWTILERIAPRPMWERIAEVRRRYQARTGKQGGAKPGATSRPAPLATAPRPKPKSIAEHVRITKLANAMLRIFCPLRYYGGPKATSRRDGGTERRKVTLTPADLGPLVELINKQLAGKAVCAALPNENTLVITCAEAAKDLVLGLLAEIDRPRPQVEIAARIFEVSHEFDFQFGAHSLLEHMTADNTQRLASTFSTRGFLDSLTNVAWGANAYQGSALRLLQVFGNSGWTVDVTFQALAETGLLKEVASPRMTVMVGQTGYMLAGQEMPILSARVSNDQLVTEKTSYKPIGIQLYVTPQIAGEDAVKMHVVSIVSAIAGFNPRMTMDQTEFLNIPVNPVLDSREAETSVTVRSGDTLVIGGLRMVRHVTRERKIPGLGDIEWLEWFFKKHRSQRQINDLYFFVTPRIVP